MKKFKEEKGITLVALIITIVVLLILAAVAIGVVKDSDIIGYAQNAAEGYEKEKERENSEIIDAEKILKEQVQGANNIPEELTKYILGSKGEGRNLMEIFPEGVNFIKDPADSTSTVHEKIKIAYYDWETSSVANCYIRYNRDVYKFGYSITENGPETLKDSINLVNSPEGNLGKYVTYKNNTWIVLKDDESGVELISANGLGELKFEESESDFNAERLSYNNFVSTIVDKCKSETGITDNIRSAGGPASEPTLSDTNTIDFSKLVETTEFSPTVEIEQFEKYEGDTNGLRAGDKNYEEDYERMKKLGILITDNLSEYWLASRLTEVKSSNYIDFRVWYVSDNKKNSLWMRIFDDAQVLLKYPGDNFSCAVRPIISLEAGTLKDKTETGLQEDPIVLN